MPRVLLLVLLLLLLCCPATQAASPVVTDDGGTVLRLEHPARRIIVLYGAFSDMLGAMGLEDRIIAHTSPDSGDASASMLPVVGTHMRPNLELIVGLKPDLVLQMEGREEAGEAVAALRQLGIPTAFFRVRSFAELYSAIERLGLLTGSSDAAATLVQSLQLRLDAVTRALQEPIPVARPTVFFEVRYPNLLAAAPQGFVRDIITAAGGLYCLEETEHAASRRVMRLNEEGVLRLNPDVYLVQQGPMNKNPQPLAQRPHFAPLRAVREGRVLVVEEFIFSRPGPRAVDAVEQLAAFLHPQRFSSKASVSQEKQ